MFIQPLSNDRKRVDIDFADVTFISAHITRRRNHNLKP
ncbi:Uncharacterised protein [Vibrio cholerae]|nr:Uncharacterised protein [Vibrio cholerae]